MNTTILQKITTGRRGRAQKVCIYAPEGFGKSTLASYFPTPLFLDVEDSTSQLDVIRLDRSALPDLKTFESALTEIARTKPCATLIVDTIDWLEQMAADAIIADAANPKIQSIEDFGYGKGYTILKERMTLLLAKFDAAVAAGVTVVLLAHSRVTKFEPPDGAGPYDRYELKLSRQVAPLIKEWADMLLFGNWRTQIREREKNESGAQFKAVGGKERLMHCTRSASWDAKNRHGMADTGKWDIGVIEKAFVAVGAPWGEPGCANSMAILRPSPSTPPTSLARICRAGASPATEATGAVALQTTPARICRAGAPPAEATGAVALQTGPSGPSGAALLALGNGTTDVELARICAPHADAINTYLRGNHRIKAHEDWRAMPADFAVRVKKNPAGFLKVARHEMEVAP
jgi:hypothetical protein